MAKSKTIYVCSECGYETARWLGKCPDCGNWNTLVEEEILETKSPHALTTAFETPRRIAEVDMEELPRFMTGSGELDRVLGGGLIPGSIILIAGDPGVFQTLAQKFFGQRLAYYMSIPPSILMTCPVT